MHPLYSDSGNSIIIGYSDRVTTDQVIEMARKCGAVVNCFGIITYRVKLTPLSDAQLYTEAELLNKLGS